MKRISTHDCGYNEGWSWKKWGWRVGFRCPQPIIRAIARQSQGCKADLDSSRLLCAYPWAVWFYINIHLNADHDSPRLRCAGRPSLRLKPQRGWSSILVLLPPYATQSEGQTGAASSGWVDSPTCDIRHSSFRISQNFTTQDDRKITSAS
jgi:hypothetical protein